MKKNRTIPRLEMERRALAALRSHARRAAPEECCGALLTDDEGVVVRAVPVENEATRPGSRYLIGAATVSRMERLAVRSGLQLAGFYHSHPSGAGDPSEVDLAWAWPWYVYVIVGAETVRAWRLREDRSAFDELEVARAGEAAA